MSRRHRNSGNAVPSPIVQSSDERKVALKVLASEATFDPNTYLFDDAFKPGNPSIFHSVHTMAEMMECLDRTDADAEGIFIEANSEGVYRFRRIKGKEKIKEAWKSNNRRQKFREARIHEDSFDSSTADSNAGLVGDDFVPLLGGPFNKQPYLYDYLRAHAYCFHEYHHHPFARAIVHITRDFVLGRGFRVDSDDDKALALWRAFEEVNNLQQFMEQAVVEGSIYGENMIWWLPNQESFVSYQDYDTQQPDKVLIPRIRLIDPSTVWEIVTYPEDISRVLYYQQVFPTQYQIYTGTDGGKPVPSSKFISQQIPAGDVQHYKYNCVSNEKRGRSDLFPVLGYLKWVRDCVNYKLISLKKQAAWCEDIKVDGSQSDVDALANAFQQMGSFAPAGSRFIHTKAIERTYLSNQMGQNGKDESLDWGLNMIAAGVQIPVSYFGLSHSSGQTRASALVGTEPVAKKFEQRQKEAARIIQGLWRRFQDQCGVKGSECEVTFPEVISQDSDAKIKRLKLAEDCEYISHETAAPIAAKELDLDNYDYDYEQSKIKSEKHFDPTIISPLTAPPQAPAATPGQPRQAGIPKPPSSGAQPGDKTNKPSAVTSDEKRALRIGMGA